MRRSRIHRTKASRFNEHAAGQAEATLRSWTRCHSSTPSPAPTTLLTVSVSDGKREWLNSWDDSAPSERASAHISTVHGLDVASDDCSKNQPQGMYKPMLP